MWWWLICDATPSERFIGSISVNNTSDKSKWVYVVVWVKGKVTLAWRYCHSSAMVATWAHNNNTEEVEDGSGGSSRWFWLQMLSRRCVHYIDCCNVLVCKRSIFFLSVSFLGCGEHLYMHESGRKGNFRGGTVTVCIQMWLTVCPSIAIRWRSGPTPASWSHGTSHWTNPQSSPDGTLLREIKRSKMKVTASVSDNQPSDT